MNLIRTRSNRYGIFGELHDDAGTIYETLEHAYCTEWGWLPKLPLGTYTCQRGLHCLHNGIPFETFEITGVPNHSGILFHVGNYNDDSDGCILIGLGAAGNTLVHSKAAFDQWMKTLEGINEFTLEVT